MAAGSAGKNAVSGIASGVSNAVPSGNKDVQLPSNGSGTQVILLLLHQVKVNLCLPLQLLLNQVVLLQVFLLQAIPAQFLLKKCCKCYPYSS